MPIIHQLSAHVADLIAAGEVVERPSSVAKELLENAVDAGASHIAVEIQSGGMTYIRVTDDGCGMDAQDAKTAFLRHATSKIQKADDLASISTMGFRGEALAAIASVSHIDLLTKSAAKEAGISLHLRAGTITQTEPAGCPVGTTIIIRDLFFNTPARMKFMKSDSVESSAVLIATQKQALSHPDIAFTLVRDGQQSLVTPGDGDLQNAIYAIFGRQFALDLVEVKSKWENISISGFVTKPTATRGNRSHQNFFVNDRPVQSKMLIAALETAFKNQMMVGRFPSCVLHISLPANVVDVNVHPAKTEVKFLSERGVFDAIHYGVLSALSHASGTTHLKMGKSTLPPSVASPKTTPTTGAKNTGGFFQKMDPAQYREFASVLGDAPWVSPKKSVVASLLPKQDKTQFFPVYKAETESVESGTETKSPSEKFVNEVKKPTPSAEPVNEVKIPLPSAEPVNVAKAEKPAIPRPSFLPVIKSDTEVYEGVQKELPLEKVPNFTILGEAFHTYIMVQVEGELIFIDKHAAHERILFEKLKATETDIMSQLLLSPITASLTPEEAQVLMQNTQLLGTYGFGIDDFGEDTIIIRQIPCEMDETSAESALQAMASHLIQGRRLQPHTLRDHLLHTIACKGAIKGGWNTQRGEEQALVTQVLSRDDIRYCPHGRPICITLTQKQLERQFGRG